MGGRWRSRISLPTTRRAGARRARFIPKSTSLTFTVRVDLCALAADAGAGDPLRAAFDAMVVLCPPPQRARARATCERPGMGQLLRVVGLLRVCGAPHEGAASAYARASDAIPRGRSCRPLRSRHARSSSDLPSRCLAPPLVSPSGTCIRRAHWTVCSCLVVRPTKRARGTAAAHRAGTSEGEPRASEGEPRASEGERTPTTASSKQHSGRNKHTTIPHAARDQNGGDRKACDRHVTSDVICH